MALTEAQVKDKIKNLASQNGADARVLLRIYMIELAKTLFRFCI